MYRVLLTIAILASLISIPLMTVWAATGCAAHHTVLPGENLFRIGLRYGLQWPVVASANGISDPRSLKAGQVLCIPTVLVTSTTAPGGTQTVTPLPTAIPTATLSPSIKVPTFTIVSVLRDQSVTISAINFPPNRSFDVLMGPMGTKGIDGTKVGAQNSGSGAFTATYNVPASLRGSSQIAIRLENTSGYFSYNWFYNSTAP